MSTADETPVYEAKVVAMFPPRPDAFMTSLHSSEFLPGVQTMLYSLKVRRFMLHVIAVIHLAEKYGQAVHDTD